MERPRSLDLLSDFSERVSYNMPMYSVQSNRTFLSNFQNMEIPSHWHDDWEFFVLLSGEVIHTVNGKLYQLSSGQGIFINSRQLHGLHSFYGKDCEYVNLLVHLSLVCANPYIEKNYIQAITTNGAFVHAILNDDTEWQSELIACVRRINKLRSENAESLGLAVQSISFRIAELLYINMPKDDSSGHIDQRLSVLRNMTGLIQRYYSEKITLQDIADAGNVSKATCCSIFRQHLQTTPNSYLTRYRLEKGTELLRNPDLSVTEVAYAIGFSGSSYFTENFRKHFGITPSEYRKSEK